MYRAPRAPRAPRATRAPRAPRAPDEHKFKLFDFEDTPHFVA